MPQHHAQVMAVAPFIIPALLTATSIHVGWRRVP
jgi:hypothetical protein